MRLAQGHHLAYCANIHRGETWAETLGALETYTLAVKERVCPSKPYAIGLRLSAQAARELAQGRALAEFQALAGAARLLRFHHQRLPLRTLSRPASQGAGVPPGLDLARTAGLHQPAVRSAGPIAAARAWKGASAPCRDRSRSSSRRTSNGRPSATTFSNASSTLTGGAGKSGRTLHLGLEPEPLGLFETTAETVEFFGRLRDEHPGDPRLEQCLGVNYDTCHLAVEYENPAEALARCGGTRSRSASCISVRL
jgi:hypothetical protein